ncbi:prepilin-type N-terminal cleavage/methylation domain-containing protein, partial [Candidatus Dependentiae bacterium]|nr:prepilin-type N-terminal cleavage/methylation domain-containing protein [Candidatus Dependentiae bacterium]
MIHTAKEQNLGSGCGALRKGFSLVEIAIVVMIIGVLMAGAFGGLRMLQRVTEGTARTKAASLKSAIEQYSA